MSDTKKYLRFIMAPKTNSTTFWECRSPSILSPYMVYTKNQIWFLGGKPNNSLRMQTRKATLLQTAKKMMENCMKMSILDLSSLDSLDVNLLLGYKLKRNLAPIFTIYLRFNVKMSSCWPSVCFWKSQQRVYLNTSHLSRKKGSL